MTITHEQIAGMTLKKLDKAIAKRLDFCINDESFTYWEHAGMLLEMMVTDCVAVQVIHIKAFDNWAARYERTPTIDGDICFTAPTAPEAIARCWLEWWEVTHDPASSGA